MVGSPHSNVSRPDNAGPNAAPAGTGEPRVPVPAGLSALPAGARGRGGRARALSAGVRTPQPVRDPDGALDRGARAVGSGDAADDARRGARTRDRRARRTPGEEPARRARGPDPAWARPPGGR